MPNERKRMISRAKYMQELRAKRYTRFLNLLYDHLSQVIKGELNYDRYKNQMAPNRKSTSNDASFPSG